MCAASSSLCGEWKLKRRTWRHQRNQLQFFSMETTYAVIFAHKGKSNTSFGTVKGLLLCLCTHNINKMSCFYLEQEHFTKMNRKTANTCLTDMINISIESFKLLLNEINKNKNKNSLI